MEKADEKKQREADIVALHSLAKKTKERQDKRIMENKEMILTFIGMDGWDRPVYKDSTGRLWKDVNPTKDYAPELCTSVDNEFDGEPDCSMGSMKRYEGVKVVFSPERVIW